MILFKDNYRFWLKHFNFLQKCYTNYFQTIFLFACFLIWKLCFRFAKRFANMTAGIDNIGAMIRNERLRSGMTQEELGELVGVGKAQISKIESGKGLTIKTVTKVLGALGLSASVSFKSEQRIGRKVVGYIVAAINEFAAAHRMTVREAGNYLLRYKGIDFLAEHYEAEHLLSLDDSVQDLTRVCINNGGGVQ